MSKWSEKFYLDYTIKAEDEKTMLKIAEDFSDIAYRLKAFLPDGRYKSLVLTHLEIAAAFATKAFTHGE